MAFFDDFGKKISGLGQTAAQKTKGVTDMARLGSAISEEERTLNNTYREIGRIYVQTHADNPEPTLADYVRAATDTERKIAAYRQQLQEAKGTILCPSCGNHVTANSSFCNLCGCKLPAPSQHSGMPCPRCGNPLNPSANFCNICGLKVDSSHQAPPAHPQMPNIPRVNSPMNGNAVQTTNPQNIIACPNCGKSVNGSLNFCTMCGVKFDKPKPNAPSVPVDKSPFARPEPAPVNENVAPKPEEPSKIICKNCGSDMNPGLNFCTVCGTPLSENIPTDNTPEKIDSAIPPLSQNQEEHPSIPIVQSVSQELTQTEEPSLIDQSSVSESVKAPKGFLDKKPKPEPKSEQTPEPAKETAGEIKCPKCGESLKSDLKFCIKCGAKLHEEPQEDNTKTEDKPETDNSTPIPIVPPIPPMSSDNSPVQAIPPIPQMSSDNPPVQAIPPIPQMLSDNPPVQAVPPIPQMSSDNSSVQAVPPIPQMSVDNSPTDEPPKERKGFFKRKPKPEKQKVKKIKCPKCGEKLTPDLQFCTSCGMVLPQAQSGNRPPVGQMPQMPPMNSDNSPIQPTPPVPPMSAEQPPIPPMQSVSVAPPSANMKRCRKCNTLVEQSVRFCTECGSPMESEPPKPPVSVPNNNAAALGKKKCHKCGAVHDLTMRFCTTCGSLLEDMPPAPSQPVSGLNNKTVYAVPTSDEFENFNQPTTVLSGDPFEEDNSPPTINLDGKMCPKCRSMMASDMLFCTECGTRL